MRGKVIELKQYQTTVRSTTGIRFPQLYRMYGYCYDEKEFGKGNSVVGEKYPHPMYSLTPEDKGTNWAKLDVTPIKGFDPALDKGWIIIRHFPKSELADGYCDALFDRFLGSERVMTEYGVTMTDDGFFTLQKRKPTPGAPDHLVIYACMKPDTNTNPMARQFSSGWVDELQIVKPDGTITFDSDILYDPNEE
jgi:hypothetical protein